MVAIATSFGRTGFQDWLIQRITAVILAIYILFLTYFFLMNPELDFKTWKSLFSQNCMKYSTLLALVSLAFHAYVGFWTITTDYIKNVVLRLLIQVIVIITLLGSIFWGGMILWSLK